jgi:hypothetical protein
MTAAGPLRRTAAIGLLASLGLPALAGALLLVLRPEAWTPLGAAAGLAVAVLAWARPVLAAAALLALAPICGNRPTTGPFLALVTLTAWAVPGWLARLAWRDRAAALEALGTRVGAALCAYGFASLLSLSSLPLYAPASIVGATAGTGALSQMPAALAAADVVAPIYPVLTVVLTLHALVAALVVAVGARRDAERSLGVDAATLVVTAVAAGLVLTLGAAALDRLAVIDLRDLRSFDPFTNPSGAARLQSTFGHAGWLAEYLCLATPAVLAPWLWPGGATVAGGGRVWRVVTAGLMLAAALVAIVLSYQRGGWITWAVVASGLAAAIGRLVAIDRGRPAPPMRRLMPWTAGALLLSIVAGLAVVRVAGGDAAWARFAARARTIAQVSDRQAHVTAGLRLGGLLPILGGGSESFAWRYRQEYLLAGGEFYARGRSPLLEMYGSAHNVFAQTFAGKGAAGLAALLLVVAAAAGAAIAALRDRGAPPRRHVLAAVVLGMLAAFVLYGQVQEIFYVAALQLTVFAGWGLAAGLDAPAADPGGGARRLSAVAFVLTGVLAAHLVHGYVWPGRLAEGYRDYRISEAGARLSAPERGEDGEYFQWTGARAVVSVPRQATELSFEMRRGSPVTQVVEVRFDGRLVDRVRLDADGWRRVVYPLQKVRTLPRRLELVAAPGAAGPAAPADPGVAVRAMRWGDP